MRWAKVVLRGRVVRYRSYGILTTKASNPLTMLNFDKMEIVSTAL